jgi:hypothetical protein
MIATRMKSLTVCLLLFFSGTVNALAQTAAPAVAAATKSAIPCNLGSIFEKNICSNIENNQASLIKFQLQKRSAENSLEKVKIWTQANYSCIRCKPQMGFAGGSMLRKCVLENALNVAFFLVYDMKVNMNFTEDDGRTLLDWVQDDTEKIFEEAFETENENDKKFLMQTLNNTMKFYNLFKNNGAKFSHELVKK